jgi:protein PhnA
MDTVQRIKERSGNKCELCGSAEQVSIYEVQPQNRNTEENTIMVCFNCLSQIDKKQPIIADHWKALTKTMWSEVPGVQVMAWRILNRLAGETWASESLDMLYLDEEKLAWAKAMGDHEIDATVEQHKDAYGALLNNGDTVILTKSLDVKGSSLNAKLGTVIKNIRLVENNTEQIEGRIEGQVIVILTKYVRKQG